MNQSSTQWSPIGVHWAPLGFLGALLLGACMSLFLSMAPAHAGGDSGGTPTGGGGCFTPTSWFFAKNYSGFEWENRHVCAGTSAQTVINNGAGNAASEFAAVGASGCWNNRSELEGIWWLGASKSGAFNRFPGSSNDRRDSTVLARINRSNVSEDVKVIARRKVFGNNRVVVCVWTSELPDKKVPGTKPDLLQCNSNRHFGAISIPRDGQGAKTFYKRGNGTDLAKGSTVEFGGPNASITIVQRTADGYTFNNGSTRKEWTFSAPGDCRPRCPSAGQYSAYLIRPGAIIPTNISTNAARGEYCYSRPFASTSGLQWAYRDLTNSTSEGGSTTTTEVRNNVVGIGTFPYVWTTEVTNGSVHPGPTKIRVQSAQGNTPYGDLFAETVANGVVPTQAQLAAAGAASATAKHPTVDLNETNQRAMAEGGVMNVTERTTYVSLDRRDITVVTTTQGTITVTTTTQPQRRSRFCMTTTSYNFHLTAAGAVTMVTDVRDNCQAWGAWANFGPRTTSTSTSNNGAPVVTYTHSAQPEMRVQVPEVTGFWQALTNHCNADAYASASGGFEKLNASLDPDAKHSGSAVTPKMNNANSPVWGYGARTPKGTTSEGFFDKHCAFEGRLVQRGDDRAERVFFRDNELRDIVVGLYRPANVGVVEDDGTNALATVLTRWAHGTPQVNGLSNKGAFRSYSQEGDQVFAPENGEAPVFKNWVPPQTGEALTWSVLNGQENHFLMAGNWASDGGKPNVFTTKWIFAPNVANRLAVNRVGFGEAGGGRSFGPEVVATKVQGQVMGMTNGAEKSPALTEEVAANTGSGVTENELDPTLLAGAPDNKWTTDPTANGYYNVIRFVRAIGG